MEQSGKRNRNLNWNKMENETKMKRNLWNKMENETKLKVKQKWKKNMEQNRKWIKTQSDVSTHFGSYLMSERLRAFLSIVFLIVSVSEAFWFSGVGLVLAELPEPPDVIVCDAVKRFEPLRFDSSKALSASAVSADGGDLAGKSWRTAEFAKGYKKGFFYYIVKKYFD